MSKVLEKCRSILATQRRSDNESLKRLVKAVAREMKVFITETDVEHAVRHLKYGCVIW